MQPTRTGHDNNALLSWHLLKSQVMLYGTIHKDVMNTALQCWNNVGTIRNNVATLYCAKKSLLRSHGCRVQFVYDNQASYASLFARKLEP